MTKQIALGKVEEQVLDDLAEHNDFWASIRAKYAEYDALTESQYALLRGEIEKRAWQKTAKHVLGVPVRNKFADNSGRPKCAERSKPYCSEIATEVVGQWAYCAPRRSVARKARRRNESRERADANNSVRLLTCIIAGTASTP